MGLGLFVAFVALALACGGTGGSVSLPKVVGTVKKNEDLVFNDSTWVLVEAKDLGKVLKSRAPDDPELKADGRFVQVRYKVTNTGKQTIWLGDDPVLVDDRDRTFDTLADQEGYLPAGAKTLGDVDSDQIPAGITREFYALYEVPAAPRGCGCAARRSPRRSDASRKGSSNWDCDVRRLGTGEAPGSRQVALTARTAASSAGPLSWGADG